MLLKEKIEGMEKKYVLRIYQLLLAILLINPLLGQFVSNTTILRFCELLCLIYALYCVYRLFVIRKLVGYHGYLRGLLFLLFVISVEIVIRAQWPSSIKEVLLNIISPSQFLIYILPFLILFLPNGRYFDDILSFFYKASLFVIPLWLININNLVYIGTFEGEAIGALLPFFSAFLLGLLSRLSSKRQGYVTFLIWFVFFILMILNARRNVSFSLALYALIAYVVTVFSNIKRNPIKYFLIVVFSFFMLVTIQINMDKMTSGVFNNMAQRATLDTRSGVEELFFLDFFNSPIEDWIFGRGMNGGYLQKVVNESTGEVSDTRSVIETGYLNMILKGGLLYVLIILLIMFYTISKGIKTKRKEYIYIAIILSTYLIDLYTTNPVCIYSVRSIIFWFIISVLNQVVISNNVYMFRRKE